MTDAGNAIRLAKAVATLASEHGLPNRFRASEVADLSRLTPMGIGRLCTNTFASIYMRAALAEQNIEFVRYEKQLGGSYLVVEAAL